MDNAQLKAILLSTKTIAIVGLSSNPEKDSYSIAAYLQQQGYRIIPVNPTADQILGEKAYPDLASVPVKVYVIEIFHRSEDVPPIADGPIYIGATVGRMQL